MDTLEGMTSLTDSLAELLRSSQEDQSFASALRSAGMPIAGSCVILRRLISDGQVAAVGMADTKRHLLVPMVGIIQD